MMMQTNRRLMVSLFGGNRRLCHTNPLGPSRGEKPPPWAAEKLVNEGYTPEQIKNNWRAILDTPDQGPDRIENFFKFVRRSYDISPEGIKNMIAARKLRLFREDQIFKKGAEADAGPDISAARFLLRRSAGVKFKNSDQWVYGQEHEHRLPSKPHPNFIVEAIDLRGFQIIHRGFENIARCRELKALKLVNQSYVDDFCIDAVSGMFNSSLEYLDISGCKLVTERGLSCLHRCKSLKLLNLYNLPNVKHPELLALLLEEALPSVQIRGIHYLKEPEEEKES